MNLVAAVCQGGGLLPETPDAGQIAAFFSVFGPSAGLVLDSPFVPLQEEGGKCCPAHLMPHTLPTLPPPSAWSPKPFLPQSGA